MADRNLLIKRILPRNLRSCISLTLDLLALLKWLLIKLTAVCLHMLGLNGRKSDNFVIKFGNLLFGKRFPYEVLDSYQTYYDFVTPVDDSLKVYGKLGDISEWITNMEILDLGAGLGQYSEALSRMGARKVVALEYQKKKVDWIKRNNRGNFETVEGSASCLPFDEESFDTVFSHTVFEHLPDVELALSEAHRVVRKGGSLVLSFNYVSHRSGHHLSPFIHFPWPLAILPEPNLCRYWSECVAEAQALGGMGFYEKGASISSLSGGAEIHLNKMNFLDFEKNALEAGWTLFARWSSERWGRVLPWLAHESPVRHEATGTVYYNYKKR